MISKKSKTFSSIKEILKTYLPNSAKERNDPSNEGYARSDYDLSTRLANDFRSALESKGGQQSADER
jgi:hypothetical protein